MIHSLEITKNQKSRGLIKQISIRLKKEKVKYNALKQEMENSFPGAMQIGRHRSVSEPMPESDSGEINFALSFADLTEDMGITSDDIDSVLKQVNSDSPKHKHSATALVSSKSSKKHVQQHSQEMLKKRNRTGTGTPVMNSSNTVRLFPTQSNSTLKKTRHMHSVSTISRSNTTMARVSLKTVKLINERSEKIAQQITLLDFDIFRKIHPRECLGQAWKKKNKLERAPNLFAFIEQFNNVARWTQVWILKQVSLRDRVKVLRKCIKIAQVILCFYFSFLFIFFVLCLLV